MPARHHLNGCVTGKAAITDQSPNQDTRKRPAGTLAGTIATEERGSNGFGYDTIFIPEGSDRTFAEMTAEEKNDISMRRLAVERMKEELKL